jgi:general secretion pathway protein G
MLQKRAVQAGFTMLEAMVAIAVLALMTAMVAPNMARWYSGLLSRVAVTEIQQQLAVLQSQALFGARDFTLAQGLAERVKLPTGWVVKSAQDGMFWRNGQCSPGVAQLSSGSANLQVTLANVQCDLQVQASVAAPEPATAAP